jgi:hypothetical protein
MLIAENYNYLRQQQREDMLTQAYLTAAWSRTQKRLPSLKQILEDSKPKKPQTDEQMLDVVKLLQTQFGGEV